MTLNLYKSISIVMAIIFALVGILFLFTSDGVLGLFNQISDAVGMEQAAPATGHFYVILAVAYMYVVALLSFMMYRNPTSSVLPFLLFNAKGASFLISFFLFFLERHLLIYITNAVVDGVIGLLVIIMYRNAKRRFE